MAYFRAKKWGTPGILAGLGNEESLDASSTPEEQGLGQMRREVGGWLLAIAFAIFLTLGRHVKASDQHFPSL